MPSKARYDKVLKVILLKKHDFKLMCKFYQNYISERMVNNMKSTPVKGTRDYLPKEVEIRDYLQNVIADGISLPES